MQSFSYRANPAQVVFGQGTIAQIESQLDTLGVSQPLFLSTPPQADQVRAIAATLGSRSVGVFEDARVHTPIEVSERALKHLKSKKADGIVSIGGGSTIGLGKALAFRTNLPHLVVPTTFAGSEMTPILGETADGTKRTLSSDKVLPSSVIYDVDLVLTLPPRMAGLSGMNAIAHAVEALYAKDANPIISMLAHEAIGTLAKALPKIIETPDDTQARADALYGAWLCGTCLGSVGMALHHKLCHTIGGMFDLPHAETHCVILPHALTYNAPAIPDVIADLRATLGTDDPARTLFELGKTVGAPDGLKDVGMPEGKIDETVEKAMSNAYWNPRALEKEPLTKLIERAWSGAPPS